MSTAQLNLPPSDPTKPYSKIVRHLHDDANIFSKKAIVEVANCVFAFIKQATPENIFLTSMRKFLQS